VGISGQERTMHKVLLETGLGQGRRLIVLIYPTGTSRALRSIWLVDLESRILRVDRYDVLREVQFCP
jgi:hypothetical protein